MRKVNLIVLAVGAICLLATAAMAQDPIQVDPKHYKVEVDNDQVRVLRFHMAPKESSPMHSHPANVLVALTDGHVKIISADGKSREVTRKAGAVTYRPAEKHAVENLGDKDYESITVELKTKSAAKQ